MVIIHSCLLRFSRRTCMVLVVQERACPVFSCFSVSCPVCNKVVVLPLGLRGAAILFDPLRPSLGFATLALLSMITFEEYALYQLRNTKQGFVVG